MLIKNIYNDSPLGFYFRRLYFAGNKYYCPVCDRYARRFLRFGSDSVRINVRCPYCFSLERHRASWPLIQQRILGHEGSCFRLLDIAPSKCLALQLQSNPNVQYLTIDLDMQEVDAKMNLTELGLADENFELIYCSHVLEHIVEDARAINEMYRVLTKGGVAIVIVPLSADVTLEDRSVTDPRERKTLYGQYDHVRRYGPDFVDRLIDGGFEVKRITESNAVGPERAERYRVGDSPIYICLKN